MPIAAKYRVEWTGLPGTSYLTTFYVDWNAYATNALRNNAAYAYANQLSQQVVNSLDWEFLPEVVAYDAPDTPTGVYSFISGVQPGSGGSTMSSRATQGLVRLDTDAYNGARRIRGKTFVPGVPSGMVNVADGTPTSPYLTFLNACATQAVASSLMIASRATNTFHGVTGGSGWSEFAVLRSRRD